MYAWGKEGPTKAHGTLCHEVAAASAIPGPGGERAQPPKLCPRGTSESPSSPKSGRWWDKTEVGKKCPKVKTGKIRARGRGSVQDTLNGSTHWGEGWGDLAVLGPDCEVWGLGWKVLGKTWPVPYQLCLDTVVSHFCCYIVLSFLFKVPSSYLCSQYVFIPPEFLGFSFHLMAGGFGSVCWSKCSLVSKGRGGGAEAASLPKMLLLFVEIDFFFLINPESVWKEQSLYIFLLN